MDVVQKSMADYKGDEINSCWSLFTPLAYVSYHTISCYYCNYVGFFKFYFSCHGFWLRQTMSILNPNLNHSLLNLCFGVRQKTKFHYFQNEISKYKIDFSRNADA